MKLDFDNIDLISNESFKNKILSIYPWAEEYCYYYIFVFYAIRTSVIDILNDIPNDDRKNCTIEKAYYYLQKHEKQKINLAVIIPTCNRPKAIKYILEYTALSYRRRGVDIIIYDSSDNCETENIVKDIRNKGYFNIFYKRYEGSFDGFSLDHKVISAYEEFYEEYDYIWLCRDGLVPIVDEMIDKISHYKVKKIGCIILDTLSRNYGLEIEKYYKPKKDCDVFLTEQATRLQTLGMLIFSKDFIKKVLNRFPLSEKTYSLWQMAVPFYAFAKCNSEVVFFTKNVFAENIYASKTHFWSKAEKLFEQWAVRWTHVINSLPEEYDASKKDCLMVYTIDFHPFSPAAVMKMRTQGGLNCKIVKKYEKYLRVVTKTPLWYFYLIAMTPRIIVNIIQWIAYHNINFSRKIIKHITKDIS